MNSAPTLDMDKLIQIQDQPCISIYLPTSESGTDIRGPFIRLKNAIRECEKQLGDRGTEPEDVSEITGSLKTLLHDKPLLSQPDQLLAIFACCNFFQYYRFPMDFTQQIVVSNQFYIKPLVPLLTLNKTFYILSLSLHQVKLYEATYLRISEKSLKNSPKSIQDLLQYEEVQKQIQCHTMPRGKSVGSSAIFHGHGNVADETKHKKDITQFLHVVDKGVTGLLSDERNPLILAGVDYIRAAYTKLSDYPNVLPEGIDGNPELLNQSELHQAAWDIVEPLLTKEIKTGMERYGDLSNSKRTSANIRDILPAAHQARVDTLLVDGKQCLWGLFDPETNHIQIHREPEMMDEDLLNLTVIYVLSGGGKVYMPSAQQMPEGSALASIFRY